MLSYGFDPDGRIAREGLGIAADRSAAAFHEGARRLWRERNDRSELSARVRAYLGATHGLDAVTKQWVELFTDLRES